MNNSHSHKENQPSQPSQPLQEEAPQSGLEQKVDRLELQLQHLQQETLRYQNLKEEYDQLLAHKQVLEGQLKNISQYSNSAFDLQSVTDVFLTLDQQWHFTYLNSQAEKLLARNRQELMGRIIWEEFPQTVGTNFYDQLHRTLATREDVVFEEFYPLLDSWFEVRTYLSDQSLSIYFNNITHKKQGREVIEQQELKLNTILDTTTEGLYGVDLMGHCTFINRAALALFGYSEEECLGKDMHQLVHYKHPDGTPFPKEVCPFLSSLTAGKSVVLVEEIFWHKDGSPLPTLFSCSPIVEKEKIIGGVITLIDLRERKQVEALQVETEARFRMIWETASDAVALSNREGTVIAANPAYYTLYGYQPDQIIGQNFSLIFPVEQRDFAKEQYTQIFDGPKTVQAVEATIKRADGTERIVEVSYDFISQNGERTAMISVVRDITQRINEQEALRKVLLELKQVDQLKDEFVALVVHDLRTPLTSVSGYAHLLKRNLLKPASDKDEVQEQLSMTRNLRSIEAIIHQAGRMEELISRLLEFSRIQAGKLELNYNREANLIELVRTVVEDQSVTTEEYTIELEVPQEEVEIVTSFDAARIEQVLNNLISNPIKYSPTGTKITVGIEQRPTEAEVLVWIKDQGYGISPQAQAHLFERYYREHNTETNGISGMGLGLYISYEIISKHKGRLWVESQPGQGSTFYFTLPIRSVSG